MRRLPCQPGGGELSLADDLRAAKALISDPKNWCKGHYHDRGRFCAMGACRAVVRATRPYPQTEERLDRIGAMEKALHVMIGKCPPTWNDEKTTTHADVMAAFDQAIEKAGAKK